MREYLRVLVYPCAVGLPPTYADSYSEVPVVLDASVEIPTASTALSSGGGGAELLASTEHLDPPGFSATSEARIRPLGSHGQIMMTPPHTGPSPNSARSDVLVPTETDRSGAATTTVKNGEKAVTSRLRAGLDRLRRSHRTASPPLSLSERPLNIALNTTPKATATVDDNKRRPALPVIAISARTHPRVVAAQLHYTAASLLCELEHRGVPLPTRLAAGVAQSTMTHYTTSMAVLAGRGGGVRECAVYPLEEGRYMATLLVPPTAWHVLGPAVVPLIVETAIRGYDISGPVAAATTAPVYFPLDARLKENAQAVQAALTSRLEEIAGLIGLLHAQRRAQAPTAAQASRRSSRHSSGPCDAADAEAVVRRLVSARPSPLQCGGDAVSSVMSRLLRQAIAQGGCRTSTDLAPAPAMTSATLTSSSVTAPSVRRFVAVGFGVWQDGVPVYSSGASAATSSSCVLSGDSAENISAWYEGQLLPAALVVTMAHVRRLAELEQVGRQGGAAATSAGLTPHTIAAEIAAQRPTERLLACFSSHQDARLRNRSGAGAGGFVDVSVAEPERMLMTPSRLCLCVAARSGWTVVVVLEPSAVPFVGHPLEGMVVGLRQLCSDHLAAPAFQVFMRSHCPRVALQALRDGNGTTGDTAARQPFARIASFLPQQRTVSAYSVGSVGLLALVRAMRVCVRCTAHGSGIGFSVSALAALHGDVSLFSWKERPHNGKSAAGESDDDDDDNQQNEDGVSGARVRHTRLIAPQLAALVSAAVGLKPLSRRLFLKHTGASDSGGMRCGPHSLFALCRPLALASSGSSKAVPVPDRVTVFHAFKAKGPSTRRSHGSAASASTSSIVYVVLELRQSEYMAHVRGDSRPLLALTTWLLNKAYA